MGPKQSLKTVHAFIDDGLGNFWLPTNNGLFKVQKDQLVEYAHGRISDVYFYMFAKQNGLRTNEFNGGCDPAYIFLEDSTLSLPSIDGLVWFNPYKTKLLYPDKKVYFEKLLIDNRPLNVSGNEITLNPGFTSFSVTLSSPYFGNPENVRLEYNIKGLNNIWELLPANGEIKLGPVPAESYQLVVRKNSGRDQNHYDTAQLSILVKPWFYNTWWFYLTISLLIVLVSYLIILQRLKALREKSVHLEDQVAVRTKELNNAIEELGHSEQALIESNRVKDRIVTMVLHDLKSPIRFLSILSGAMLAKYPMADQNKLKDDLSEIDSGLKGLREFTDHFFIWARTQQENFVINKVNFPIQKLFLEMSDLYGELVKVNNNRLTFIPTNIIVHTDYQILGFIVRNLIDNANKNTVNGNITVAATCDADQIVLSVSDSGQGMSDMQLEQFLDQNRKVGRDGTGSILILEMLTRIEGKLEIKTAQSIGSTFLVKLYNLPQYETAAQDGSVP